jgi:hypothetical protein
MHEGENARKVGTVSNSAVHSQVGIQAASVTGSTVNMGTPFQSPTPVGLAAELAALRDELKREHATGKVDDLTYEAAEAELDTAGRALEENTPAGKSKFVLALKRLRGLIADVAELAVKVGTVIAAVKGLT